MNFLFISKDQAYKNSIYNRLKKDFPEETIEFESYWPEPISLIHQKLYDIVQKNPDVIIVDFSLETETLLSLTRNFFRTVDSLKGVIGVWNILVPKHLLYEGNFSGAKINHFKGSEVGEVAVHAMFLAKSGQSPLRKFATARAMKELWKIDIFHRMKIGFMTKSYLHVEHDVPLEDVDPILLTHHMNQDFPTTKFKFLRSLNKNFYYHFRYSSDIQIIGPEFKEPPKDEGSTQKANRVKHEKEEWQYFDRRMNKFLEAHAPKDGVASKRTRVLVFDTLLNLSKEAKKSLDKYDYSIRLYRRYKKGTGVLNRIRPGIIVYCWDEKEGSQQIFDLINEIKNDENYKPFVIIFSAPLKTSEMRSQVDYQQLLCEESDFQTDSFFKLCDLYQNKEGREKTHDQSTSFHTRENRVYFKKNDPQSQLSLKVAIEVKEISESWFKFRTTLLLPMHSIFELEAPLSLFLTIVEQIEEAEWSDSKSYQYKAIIHGLPDSDRAHLRRLINSTIQIEMNKEKSQKKEE